MSGSGFTEEWLREYQQRAQRGFKPESSESINQNDGPGPGPGAEMERDLQQACQSAFYSLCSDMG